MKILQTILALGLLLFGQTLKAQISYGGTPVSFGSKFQDLPTAHERIVPYLIPRLDMNRVYAEDKAKPSNRFAVATAVDIKPENSGIWQNIGNGDRLWRVALYAQNTEVKGMRLLFDKFKIPEGGKLFIYTEDHQTVLGAFTHENNHESGLFATTLIEGTEVWIEYYEPAQVAGKLELYLNRIDQAYKNPFLSKVGLDKKGNGYGDSGSCNLNINCTTLANDWQDEKRGVLRILTVDSQGSGWCTGSLINNTAQNNKALFLTANHCGEGSSTSNLNQWTFVFNYEISSANCSSPFNPSTSQSMTGASLKANYASSDFFLLELNQTIPLSYNAYFNGWDKTGVNPPSSVGIHHPSGDVKKFSLDSNPTTTTNYGSSSITSSGTHFRVVWNNGVTEGGSSGSPLFDNNGRIIGQLHGGGSSCSAPTSADWYGRVSVSWTGGGTSSSSLSTWLDPTNSGVTTLAGKENGNSVVANFNYSPTRIIYQPNQMTYTSTSTGATSWSWNFGAGASPATATGAGPHNVTYNTTGVKTVTLSINGNASTSTQSVAVLPAHTPDYLLANGGNMESTDTQFIGLSVAGTTFESGNSTVVGKNGVASGSKAWVTGLTANTYLNGSETHLYTPNFNFSTTGAYRFEFKTKFATEQSYDGFIVEYSTNKGTSWTQLGNAIATGWYNATISSNVGVGGFAAGTRCFSGTISSYQTMSFDATFLGGQANVAFRFVFKSDNTITDAGVAIDDVQVFAPFNVTTFSPAHNAVNVLPTQNLQITFNRPVQKGTTGNIVIARVAAGGFSETIPATSAAITVNGNTATINPVNVLPENTLFYVAIDNGVFRDANNVNFIGFVNTTTWRFTTADITPPTVTTFNPAHNATNVAVTNNLSITFNENVKKGTSGTLNIKKVSDNSIFESFNTASTKVTVSNNVVTINPTNNLTGLTEYYVEIENGYIQDLLDNNFVGFTGNGTWKFQTASETIAPIATVFSPANNATGIAQNTNLIITFDEEVKKGTGNITIKKTSDNSTVETIAVTDANVTIANATVTINPANDLISETSYYVEIAAGAIQDISNNNYAGIVGANTWRFTTLDNTLPTLVSLSPAHNATNVPVGANLVMTFSENVKKTLVGSISIRRVSNNAIIESFSPNAVSFLNNTVTINPLNNLPNLVDCYVEVSNNFIEDMAGNAFGGFTGSSMWRFQTETEFIAPTANTFYPVNNAANFPGANDLYIIFSEAIKKGANGNITIRRLSDDTAIEIMDINSPQAVITSNRLTINPSNNLAYNTEFYVEITAGAIEDLVGNGYAGFAGSATWRFKTDFSTALEDNALAGKVSIYPNPTDQFATVQVQKGTILQEAQLRILDGAGKVLWQTQTYQLAERQRYDLGVLPAGKYFLEIKSKQGSILKTIIKQ